MSERRGRYKAELVQGRRKISWDGPRGGTLLTVDVCRGTGKPYLVIDLADGGNLTASVQATREWIAANLAGGILNVAGPRASEHSAVYEQTRAFLRAVLGGVAEC